MKTKWFRLGGLVVVLALLGGAALAAVTWAAPGNGALRTAPGGAPTVVSYQGEVRVSGSPYDGNGYFKFAVVNAAGSASYWSNDGSSAGGAEPAAAVELAVSEGLFSVLLGDTTLDGMTQTLTADVFSQPDRYLRVWFGTSAGGPFDQLTPDTRIAAVPYALQAQEATDAGTVDGYEGAALEESAEVDADIVAHTAISGAHHARYTDGEAWAAVLANDGAGSGLDADTVDGQHANQLETHYQNVVVVAESGGDYQSVQAAIGSIIDAAADNPYLVWVAPGVYAEQVTMKPYVHLQGAGQDATVISSSVGGGAWPPMTATLVLTRDTSLRDMTLVNQGVVTLNLALLAPGGTTGARVTDVTARTEGSGVNNWALLLGASGPGAVTLEQVTGLAENGSNINVGLANYAGMAARLRGGSFTGRGGEKGYGIDSGNGTTLEANGVTALGEEGSSRNYGLSNTAAAKASVRGGFFTGRGGTFTYGIYSADSATDLDAAGVTALGEDGSSINRGMLNVDGATATLRGGIFTGRGGSSAQGIYNGASDSTLVAESVVALGESGDSNLGIYVYTGATAMLQGGSFTGRGGTYSYGMFALGSGTRLVAESVAALGEDGSSANYGLRNVNGATATLRSGSVVGRGGGYTVGIWNTESGTTLSAEGASVLGDSGTGVNRGLHNTEVATLHGGSATGRGGTEAWGIYNVTDGAMLKTEGVAALGEDGSDVNYGLHNDRDAAAALRGGSCTGRGGTDAYGIYNLDGATLEVENVAALGEDGSSTSFGLHNDSNAEAALRGGSVTGRGGTNALGIYSTGGTTQAESVTALGEDGSSSYGLRNAGSTATFTGTQSVFEGATNSVYRSSGTVTVSNSRLAGNVVTGTVTCVLVTRAGNISTDGSTCP